MNLDPALAINTLIQSGCDVPLTVERLATKTGEKVTEYALLDTIANDASLSKSLGLKLRTLALIRLYEMVQTVQFKLMDSMDDLKPSDVARLYTSLQATIGALTVPDTKQAFDFDGEVSKLAAEFSMSEEEIKKELKQLMTKSGSK